MFYAEKLVSYSETSNNYYSQDRSSVPSKILLMTWLFKKRNEFVSCSCNWCQIQFGISACVMSSECVIRTSLYLDRLKIFEWVKFLRRHLHQIQENWAEMNLKSARTNGFHFRIINSLMKSWGYTWPGLTVMYKRNNQRRTSLEFLV